MRARITGLLMLLSALPALAHSNYTGYSGAPSRQTCASSCHGSGTGTVVVTGFPTDYAPGQAYTLTVRKTSGATISNFNASVRVGTETTNAGTITAGTNTAVYNVASETNGVHLQTANRDSGRFVWTAPSAGTGDVTLYLGAHQTPMTGTNTTLVIVAHEAASLPLVASGPSPVDNAVDVTPTIGLSWTAGTGATSHDVYFGTTNPPAAVGNQTATSYDPPGDLTLNTVYYWRVDERNSVGVTTGTLWQFTTAATPAMASNPFPLDQSAGVALTATMSWTEGAGATSHDVYFGTTNPPAFAGNQLGTSYDPIGDLTPGITYYWRIDERNPAGATTGAVWSFTTMAIPGTASNPSPTDFATGVLPTATLSWTAADGATSHDVYFGTTNPPASVGNQTATSYVPASSLTAGATYFWRIDERNSAGAVTGTVWQFTVLALPEAASNPTPANNSTNVSVDTMLSWNEGNTARFADVYFGTTNPPTLVETDFQETSFPARSLQHDMVYYWRVDTKNAAGITTGPVWQFHTAPVNAVADSKAIPADLGLSTAYPNPFNATVTIPFAITEAAPVKLLLYDDTGRHVATLADAQMGPGKYEVKWSAANAGSGTYFVTLITGLKVFTQKITALK
jgi:hypothetical protein